MKINKIGHCCLVIEIEGKKIMTDPGGYTTGQTDISGLDYILITHEHGDHIHIESLKKVLENNPNTKIITNSAVKKLLDEANIVCGVLEEGELDIGGIKLFAKTCPHADIFDNVTPVQNTGYMIADKLFYPGDAWLELGIPVPVLALPVAGPWSKIRDVLEYAIRINPENAFPVHDGMLIDGRFGPLHTLTEKVLAGKNIKFTALKAGESVEY